MFQLVLWFLCHWPIWRLENDDMFCWWIVLTSWLEYFHCHRRCCRLCHSCWGRNMDWQIQWLYVFEVVAVAVVMYFEIIVFVLGVVPRGSKSDWYVVKWENSYVHFLHLDFGSWMQWVLLYVLLRCVRGTIVLELWMSFFLSGDVFLLLKAEVVLLLFVFLILVMSCC